MGLQRAIQNKNTMKIKPILALGVASLLAFTSCEKGLDLNSELIPQETVDPSVIKAYLSTGNPPYNTSVISTTQTPISFIDETTVDLHVLLSKPAAQDVTVELAVETTEQDLQIANKGFQSANTLNIAPKGLLKLSSQSVVVKKGAVKSETVVKVGFDNRELLRSLEGKYFLAAVKVVKTSAGIPSTNFGISYVTISRAQKVIKPFNPEASVDGLSKVNPDQFIPSSQNGHVAFPPENAFDNDPNTAWRLQGSRRGGYFQIDFKTPIDLAAYRITLVGASYSFQIKDYELELSYDGGQSWKNYDRESLMLDYSDRTGWTHPLQIMEFYAPMKGVTGIRLKVLSAQRDWAYYFALADIEIFEKK